MRRVFVLLAAGLSVLTLSTAANAAIQTVPTRANIDTLGQTALVTPAQPAINTLAGHRCYSGRTYYRPSYRYSGGYGYRPSYGYGVGYGYRPSYGYGRSSYGYGYPRSGFGYSNYRGGSGVSFYIGF